MVTLEDLHEEIKNMSSKHTAYTEKLEARLKQLEADNKALREAPPSSTENAAAVALSQTPKTKSVLEQEEAEIHKGMNKMLQNTNAWPVPSVATATAVKDLFTTTVKGMRAKAANPPPTIQAFTGLLELEGDLVSFLSAMAEGTFGNEDVRAMVANGLKSYATAFIAKKIMESEGELMKLVAKNDMPGTATMILGKVRDQIATARTPITVKTPNDQQKSIGQFVKENGEHLAAAAAKKMSAKETKVPPTVAAEHSVAAHVATPAPITAKPPNDQTKVPPIVAEAHVATPNADVVTKAAELNTLKETQAVAASARKIAAATKVTEDKASAEINHLTLKDKQRVAQENYASIKKPSWFGTEDAQNADKRRDAKKKLNDANAKLSSSRFTRRNRIIANAPNAAMNATTRSAKASATAAYRAVANTPANLKRQQEAYLENTKWGREKAMDLVDAVLSDVDAASATYGKGQTKQGDINRMYGKQRKLQELLATSKNELSKLNPITDAGDIVAKKAEIKVLTEALSKATEEITTMKLQYSSP